MRQAAGCPSDFALERFLLGELPEALSDVADHVAACDVCRAKVAAKRADDADFVRSPVAAEVRRALYATDAGQVKRAPAEPESAGSGARAGTAARTPVVHRWAFAGFAVAAAIVVGFAVAHRRAPSATTPLAVEAKDEEVVLRVQREWMEAIRDKDAAALDRILADDYTFTDSRGSVSHKADSLRQARSTAGGRMTAFQTYDEQAHIYGDTAVVTGRLRVEGVSAGQPYDAEVRFTDILARIDGRWRAVAAHASRSNERHAP